MTDLDATTIKKLSKLVPMLSSDIDGEVQATVLAIKRTLRAAGASMHDIVDTLNRKPKEKIIYRERVVFQEKIVYRERPLEQVIGADRCIFSSAGVADHCEILLGLPEITQGERSFLDNMLTRAHLAGDSLTMTPKQTIWFTDILSRYREKMTVE